MERPNDPDINNKSYAEKLAYATKICEYKIREFHDSDFEFYVCLGIVLNEAKHQVRPIEQSDN
jgi:hypothetical protein